MLRFRLLMRPVRRRPFLMVLLVAGALGLSCRERTVAEKPPERVGLARSEFHVMVVVLDACRPDKMGCYGFDRPTTPELDALAADPDSVLFRNHYVHGSWTKPSTASLFTGLYAHQHGVLKGHDPKGSPKGEEGQLYSTQVLPDKHETLAERMKKAGYRTYGVVKSQHLVPKYGFAQGFDDYLTPEVTGRDTRRVERFLELAKQSPDKSFGYLHVNACHYPFRLNERDAGYMDQFAIPYDEPARQAAGVDFTGPEIGHAIEKEGFKLRPDDVRFLNLVYEAQLRKVDQTLVGALIAGLREAGLYDNTLLIVTADHGEELYEHKGYDHGHAVWEELVHVPMIVKFPRGRRPSVLGQEVTRITRAIDVLPALLDFAGSPVTGGGLPGAAIFRGTFGDISISQARRNWALVDGEYKLIVAGGKPMLFHLRTDPGEQKDLAAREPERVRLMKTRLEGLLASGAGDAPTVNDRLTPEAEANLRALGYLR